MKKFISNSENNFKKGLFIGMSLLLLVGISSCKKAEETKPVTGTKTEMPDPPAGGAVQLLDGASAVAVGGEYNFSAAFYASDKTFSTDDISWASSDDEIITINAAGKAEAKKEGSVTLTATKEEKTVTVAVTAGSETKPFPRRTGTFEGFGSYKVTGSATVIKAPDGAVTLILSDDFTISRGPGLFMYLSTEAKTIPSFADMGEVRPNDGPVQLMYFAPADAKIALDKFNYVQAWCKPFGVSFAAATLN